MQKEVISYKDIEKFPFEGIVFTPCLQNGRVLEGATEIHYKDGNFVSYPFDEDLDDVKIFKYYIMRYE